MSRCRRDAQLAKKDPEKSVRVPSHSIATGCLRESSSLLGAKPALSTSHLVQMNAYAPILGAEQALCAHGNAEGPGCFKFDAFFFGVSFGEKSRAISRPTSVSVRQSRPVSERTDPDECAGGGVSPSKATDVSTVPEGLGLFQNWFRLI